MNISDSIKSSWPKHQFFIRREIWEQLVVNPEQLKYPWRITLLSDYVVDRSGKLVKSRTSKLKKRFTAKDIRNFDGVIINNIN